MTIQAKKLDVQTLKRSSRRKPELSEQESRERLRTLVVAWQKKNPHVPSYKTASIFSQGAKRHSKKYGVELGRHDVLSWSEEGR